MVKDLQKETKQRKSLTLLIVSVIINILKSMCYYKYTKAM